MTLAPLRVAAPPRPAVPAARRPVVFEIVVLLFLLRIYDVARSHADVRSVSAYDHAYWLLSVERALRLNVEHAVNAVVAPHGLASSLAVLWYQYLHIPVTMAVLLGVWLWRPDMYRPLRTALVLINVIGLAVFLLWPLAPPRLLPELGYVDLVTRAGHGVVGSGEVSVDQFGAMPSLHIAWAVWCAAVILVLLPGRRLRHLAWLYPAVTTVVVLVTANHYVTDVVAGVATAGVALYVSLVAWPVITAAPRLPVQA